MPPAPASSSATVPDREEGGRGLDASRHHESAPREDQEKLVEELVKTLQIVGKALQSTKDEKAVRTALEATTSRAGTRSRQLDKDVQTSKRNLGGAEIGWRRETPCFSPREGFTGE